MRDFQTEKELVRRYYQALDAAEGQGITQVLTEFTAPHYVWRAFHPFHLQIDITVVSELFWQPFRRAVSNMQRRLDVFFAGENYVDDEGSVWVCSMGHLMGLFDKPWFCLLYTSDAADE